MATKLQVDANYFVITEASGKVGAYPKKSIYYEMAKEVVYFFVGKQRVAEPYPIGLTGTVSLNTGASGSVDGIHVNGEEIMSGAKATAQLTSVTPSVLATGTVTIASALVNVFATNTAQCTSVIATDTVTVNGLLYTAVDGVKADNTEFSVDTGDNECAADLADSINNDVRSGTSGIVTAIASTDTVTLTTDVAGTGGNAITLAQTGGTITVGGATFSGGVNADTITVNGLVYTAVDGVKSDNTEFDASGTDTYAGIDFSDSVNNDTRIGTSGDISSTESTGVVTFTTDVTGTGGNAITLVSSNGSRLAVTGSGTLTGGKAADTITVNGLIYSAVSGVKSDNTKFSIDVDDNSAASDLADSITNDTRAGTLNDVTATATTDTVTITQTVGGTGGKATTLAESTSGARVTISGATFGAPEDFDTSLTQTAANVAANITAYSSNYSATNVAGLIVIKNRNSGLEVNGFVVVSETTTIATTDANMGIETGNLVDSAGDEFTGITNLLTFLRTNTGN